MHYELIIIGASGRLELPFTLICRTFVHSLRCSLIYNYDTRSHLTHLFNNSPSESHLGGVAHRAEGVDFIKEALKTLKTLETLTTLLIIKKLRHRSDGVAHRLSFSRNRRNLSPAPNKPTGSLCIPAFAHHPRRDILNSKMSMYFFW